MAIAARTGVSGVRLSKVHAAYSRGASKAQVLWHVIIPNSLPDIFAGLRVALGGAAGERWWRQSWLRQKRGRG